MTGKFIPVANPGAQLKLHKEKLMEAISGVVSSGWYILGKEVETFERNFADFLGLKHCVSVGNGTDAIAIALKAAGISEGDEVITVSHSAVATVAAIEQIGAVPVFIDIDPVTRCMDPEKIPGVVSDKTRALLPVHVYGQPAPMDKIISAAREFSLKVIEDCAQAHGAELHGKKAGTFGDAACFSFYPTKNLGALGDGGAVVTDDPKIAENALLIRQYGWKERYISSSPGINSRMDELQAAVLSVKLPFLLKDNDRRRKIAGKYYEAINGSGIVPPRKIDGTLHAMHLFVVECDSRDSLQSHMNAHGVGTARHYPAAIHAQPAYAGRIRGSSELPETEALYGRILSIPMYPELSDEQVELVCSALSKWRPV